MASKLSRPAIHPLRRHLFTQKGCEMLGTRLTSQRGGALMIALAIMFMLAVIAITAVDRASMDVVLSHNMSNQNAAFYVAEAGARRAFVEINANNDWRDGYVNELFGDGMYTVIMVDSSSELALDDTVIIRAEATVIEVEAWLELWTAPEYYYPFTYGMFAGNGLSFDQGTCTDSYNSDSGSYFETVLDEEGSIGTNGTITTSKLVTIGGDASTATGGSITLGVGSSVLGDTTTAMDSVYLDIIPQEEYDWAEANSDAISGMYGFDYTYDPVTKTLTTESSGNVVLQSGVYFFSSITMAKESEIILAPNAKVTIYIIGDIIFGQGSKVNDGGAPGALQVYSQHGSLQFDQYNSFYGAFYGPEAVIQYDQTTEVYGSLVGDFIQLDGGACFHYDRNLAYLTHNTTGRMLEIAWREI